MSKDGDVNSFVSSKPRPSPSALGINVEKPKFQQYASFSKRLESYEDWPDYIPVDRTDLAEAGLVFTGAGDSVRCYFCGGGLRNWEQGDVPMEEHAKWYPNCPHVLLVKGKDYIEKIRRGEKPDRDRQNISTDSLSSTSTNHLDGAAAQSCLQMGYSKSMVEEAVAIYIKTNENTDFKGSDLCAIIFQLEENPDYYNEDLHTTHDHTQADSRDLDENIEPLDKLFEENQRLKENRMCKICLDRRSDVLFLPCGHMVCCPQCAPAMVKCPICRKQINGHVKTFLSTTSCAREQ